MSIQKNCCGWTRPTEHAQEREKEIYNTGLFSSDTLSSKYARKCPGIMYVNFDWGLSLVCDCPRPGYAHTKCTKERCPFMKETGTCPYMKK